MKNIVRAFVVVLAITGAAATSMTAANASTKISVAKTSASPIPTCAPTSTTTCGW